MFFRQMKTKARNEGYSQGYRDATRHSVWFGPLDPETLIQVELEWALLDARRKGIQ